MLIKTARMIALLSGLVAILSSSAVAGPPVAMTFQYVDNTNTERIYGVDRRLIRARGVIAPGTAARFSELLRKYSIAAGATVVFDSPGGSVAEALALGRRIRATGLKTAVVDGCYSACTLAFLGGTERSVSSGAQFGVHQVSTSADLTPAEALEIGQLSIGEIAGYASEMGVKAEFVEDLVRATPEQINILSAKRMRELNVTTLEFITKWEIKTTDGQFYLLASTATRGRVNKMILFCGAPSPSLMFMFNTTDDVLAMSFGLEFDNTHLELLPQELRQGIERKGEYASVVIALTPRLVDHLRSSNNVTWEMISGDRTTYVGWTMDFAGGRDMFFSFLQTCTLPPG